MTPQSLYRLIYISTSAGPVTEDDISEILSGSRDRNERSQITGLLLYMKGNFLQVLEGGKDDLERLYARIKEDDRHSMVEMISRHEANHRLFSNWSMAFSEIGSGELESISGFSTLEDIRLIEKDKQDQRVKELLENFIKINSFN